MDAGADAEAASAARERAARGNRGMRCDALITLLSRPSVVMAT